MIIMIDTRPSTRSFFDGGGHAAIDLIVVWRIEDIVVAIVLVVHDGLDALEALAEGALVIDAAVARAIGIGAPGHIGASEVGAVVPDSLIDQCLEPRAIGTRFRAEDAIAGDVAGLI